MVLEKQWQPLYEDALLCLDEQQAALFRSLAPLDYIISFVIIVLARFSNLMNAVVEATLSVARINAPLFNIRQSAVELITVIQQNMHILH